MAEFNDGSSIVASPVNIVFPQYLTNDVADQYFYNRLKSDVWFQSTEQDKTAALVQSTRAIDNLNFLGVKYNLTQELAFPRWQPPEYVNCQPVVNNSQLPPPIPQDILIACCENAIVLLDDFDFEIEIAALNNTASIYAGVRETYERTLAVSHLRHGIASSVAWIYIKPWLNDTFSFTLSRVN